MLLSISRKNANFAPNKLTISFPPGLAEAETWVNVHPDSALSVLRAMKMDRADVSEEARMLHRLLTIKAEDKLYVLHTSDSLILFVASNKPCIPISTSHKEQIILIPLLELESIILQ